MRARAGGPAIILTLLMLVLVGVSLFAVPSSAAAASGLDEYRDRLSSARGIVEEYLAAGAQESPGSLVPGLLRLIPASERVIIGDGEVLADHSVFRTLLTRLDVARDPEDRVRIARDMVEHLASIERSLPQGAGPVPADPELLAELLDESRLTVRSPLADLVAELVERLAEALGRWQTALGSSSAPQRIMAITMGVLVAALAAVLVWTLVRVVVRLRASVAVRGRSGPARGGFVPVVAAEEQLPADALAHAESLAAAGRFAEAVRALFGGAARFLAEAGILTRTRTHTNNELLGEVRAGAPAAAAPLSRLSSRFESAFYGHRDPGAEGYAAAREEYDTVVERVAPDGGDPS